MALLLFLLEVKQWTRFIHKHSRDLIVIGLSCNKYVSEEADDLYQGLCSADGPRIIIIPQFDFNCCDYYIKLRSVINLTILNLFTLSPLPWL